MGDASHLQPGEEVFAVGMPRKLPFTVSRGVVSFVGREMEGARYLQVDMNINDGNSGGPVVTSNGEFVGIMSFIYRRSQGLSFALPTNEILAAFPGSLPVITPKL
jgi:serine protease Do